MVNYMGTANYTKKISLMDKLKCFGIFITKKRKTKILEKANEKIKEFNSKVSEIDQDLKILSQRKLTQNLENEFTSFYNIAAWESAPLLEYIYKLVDKITEEKISAFENEVNQWKKEKSARVLESKIESFQIEQFLNKDKQLEEIKKIPELKKQWGILKKEVNKEVENKYQSVAEYLLELTQNLETNLKNFAKDGKTKDYISTAHNTYLSTIQALKRLQEIIKSRKGYLYDGEIQLIKTFLQNKLVMPKWWLRTNLLKSSLMEKSDIKTLNLIIGILGIIEDNHISKEKFIEPYKEYLEEAAKNTYFEKQRNDRSSILRFEALRWTKKIRKNLKADNFTKPLLEALEKLAKNLSITGPFENLTDTQWQLIEEYFKEGFTNTKLDKEDDMYLPPQLSNLDSKNKELFKKLIKSSSPIRFDQTRYVKCIKKLKSKTQDQKEK